MERLIQILGIGGIIMNIISFQCNSHKKIMFYRSVNEVLFAIQYYLLHSYLGMMTNILVCFRNCLFSMRIQKNQSTRYHIFVFSILFIIIGIANWQGTASVVAIAVKILSTIAYGNKNPGSLRIITLFASSGWLLFNMFVGSYTGILCEILSLSSILFGIWRFDLYPLIQIKINDRKGILK